MLPRHIQQLRLFLKFFYRWYFVLNFSVGALVQSTILTLQTIKTRFLSTGETIDVALSNYNLLLPLKDVIDLTFSSISHLSHLADHNLQLRYMLHRFLVFLMQFLDLIGNILLLCKLVEFSIEALYVQFASQVRYLLIPKLYHVNDTFIKVFSLLLHLCFNHFMR